MSKFVTLHGFGGGSGGTELNFEVVGGTTEPTSQNENTFWINTDTPITSWIFSATQPTGVDGMVWIVTDITSTMEFNVLKENGIQIYPTSAKQYIDGAWVDVTAYSYRDGEWKLLISQIYVFKSGEGALETITKAAAEPADRYYVTIGNDYIEGHGYHSSSSADYVSLYTARKDLTGYNTLYFDVHVTEAWSSEEPRFGVASSTIPASSAGASKFTTYKVVKKSNRQTIAVDITSKDSGYIGAWGVGNFYVYNIWYE